MRSKWSHHLFLVIFFPGEFVQILTRIAEVFLTPSLGAVSHRPLGSNCRNVRGDKEGKEEVSGRAHTDLSFFFLSFFNFTEDDSSGLFRKSGKQAIRQFPLFLNINEMDAPEDMAI